jgi:hypothetical protein
LLAGDRWVVLICFERKVLLACCWWLICSERKVMLTGKPNEQGAGAFIFDYFISVLVLLRGARHAAQIRAHESYGQKQSLL